MTAHNSMGRPSPSTEKKSGWSDAYLNGLGVLLFGIAVFVFLMGAMIRTYYRGYLMIIGVLVGIAAFRVSALFEKADEEEDELRDKLRATSDQLEHELLLQAEPPTEHERLREADRLAEREAAELERAKRARQLYLEWRDSEESDAISTPERRE